MGLIEQLVGLSDAEKAAQLQAMVDGEIKARMNAHRYKEPEVARSIHASCLSSAWYHAERGNVCMAHAKRLQAKYWEKRMFAEHKTRCDQPKLGDIDPFGWVQHGWTKP